jgi:Tol biopolymer transport system component
MRNTIRFLIALTLGLGVSSCGNGQPDRNPDGLAWAGVLGASGTNLIGDTTVVVRRVFEGPAIDWKSAPSPDGRYITVVGDAGSLGRIDLVSGEILPIKDKGTWSEAVEWAETNVFSPDGTQIAYVWGTSQGYEIRISGVDGSNERTLLGPDGLVYAMVHAWQGDEILAYFFPDGPPGPEIVGISPVDGRVRAIKVLGMDWYETVGEAPLAVSPNSRFLTYAVRSPEGDADVVILRTTDGAEVGRIEGPASDIAVAWTPDGHALLFQSDRQMTEGIWRVRMEDGRVMSEPELVRGDLWQFAPVGSSRDAFFFGLKTDTRRVRVAAFDPETGALISEPTAVDQVAAGASGYPIWSPDGRAMAYVRGGPLTSDERILMVRSLSGPDAREIPLAGNPLRSLYAWTRDGRIIGGGPRAEGGGGYMWSVDLESGQIEGLVGNDEVEGRIGKKVISPDGRMIYYPCKSGSGPPSPCRPMGGGWEIVARDLETGRVETLPVTGFEYKWHYLSPDGNTLAFILRDRSDESTVLAVLPTSGGTLRELFRQALPDGISTRWGSVFWPPTGDQLFFSTHGVPATGEPQRLWRVDYSGPEPAVVELQGADGLKGAGQIVVHPDGGLIAFTAGEERGEVWMMTNLSGG